MEEDVKQKFIDAFNSLLGYRDELIDNCRLAQKTLCDCTGIKAELDNLHQELEIITELARKNIYENAHGVMSQEEWNEKNAGYQERHRKAVDRITTLESMNREKQHKSKVLDSFIRNLVAQKPTLYTFDERLWTMIVERVVISPEGKMIFQFKDGTEICR